jgi:DUF971 family protein
MTQATFYISELKQVSSLCFSIKWSDNTLLFYRLSLLQERCSCAFCVDEFTGNSLLKEGAVDPKVQASNIQNVGRYAIKINFTSGCSHGIYPFDFLRELGLASLDSLQEEGF